MLSWLLFFIRRNFHILKAFRMASSLVLWNFTSVFLGVFFFYCNCAFCHFSLPNIEWAIPSWVFIIFFSLERFLIIYLIHSYYIFSINFFSGTQLDVRPSELPGPFCFSFNFSIYELEEFPQFSFKPSITAIMFFHP